jgi:hypothetical protein
MFLTANVVIASILYPSPLLYSWYFQIFKEKKKRSPCFVYVVSRDVIPITSSSPLSLDTRRYLATQTNRRDESCIAGIEDRGARVFDWFPTPLSNTHQTSDDPPEDWIIYLFSRLDIPRAANTCSHPSSAMTSPLFIWNMYVRQAILWRRSQ